MFVSPYPAKGCAAPHSATKAPNAVQQESTLLKPGGVTDLDWSSPKAESPCLIKKWNPFLIIC